MNVRELRQRKADLLRQAEALHKKTESEDRDFTQDEKSVYDGLMDEARQVGERIERSELVLASVRDLEQPAPVQAPNLNLKTRRGDSETRAWAHWARTGDDGGIREMRASNDTDMNITTSADGGYAVPTGHYQGIIARRDPGMITARLGVRLIPGVGTTVNVPLDNEADGEFVSTSEGSDHDRDAPALSYKALTLARYTKKIQLSWELLEDEDSRLMDFLADFVGRGMAKTHNNLLITEVTSNGTSFKTFASATAIAAGEIEDILGNADLSAYLDDAGSVGWVMRSSTYWDIASITGNARMYAGQDNSGLMGYPVVYSNKVSAIATTVKSVFFGNWNYVGYREAPGFTVLRDPYSYEGGIEMRYQFRTVYGVLQAEAIGYGVQA